MDDRTIMENILLTNKGVCDLYMHGTVESSTSNVHQTFNTALGDCLCLGETVYSEMSQRGWYPSQQAQQQQIESVKQRYSSAASSIQ